ncbi:MAG TPA: DUF1684 domain-containing protein [Ohtaekwangia sp.]|nr:DUF1684 domain-containing protein [Ohtaekwangia sp.]
MKTKNILLLLVTIMVLVIVFYSFEGSHDQSSYITTIQKEREQKDNFMRTSKASPFAGKTDAFEPLRYYPPNTLYKVSASLTPIRDKKVVVLTTNDGKEERYLEYAYADFKLHGTANRLLIFEVIAMGPTRGKLFLPFGDETSARETYGAGRYLDLVKTEGSNTITLDFNQAYNPYCAYVDTYSCPLPPVGNLLQIPIEAGEKTFR